MLKYNMFLNYGEKLVCKLFINLFVNSMASVLKDVYYVYLFNNTPIKCSFNALKSKIYLSFGSFYLDYQNNTDLLNIFRVSRRYVIARVPCILEVIYDLSPRWIFLGF